MLRILRAFAWLRWRVFMNSIEKTGARDALERFSLAVEHLAPIVLALVMVPSALALAGLAGYAGYQLGAGVAESIPIQVLRFVVLAATALAIVGPLLLPVADRTNPVRLLLLPIPERTLYVAQTAGVLADPWILVLPPMAVAVAIGALAGGAAITAIVALVAGVLVILTIVGLSGLTTTVMHLALRDRRRGELLALVFVLFLPLLSLVPAMLDHAEDGTRRQRTGTTRTERRARRESPLPPWARESASGLFSATPSELYTSALTRSAEGRAGRAGASATALLAWTVVLHGVGLALFRRVLASPGATGARRQASRAGIWSMLLPGLSPGASAVALAHVRLALRTPRGRTILYTPLVMLVFFGALSLQSSNDTIVPFIASRGGLGLATFASGVALLAILPLAMNQFAVDGAGLTLSLLSPLSTRQLLAGKAVGNGLIAIPTALLCVAIAAVVFGGGGTLAAWLNLVLSLVATYTLASPAAAIFSAMLPRVVDMNSIGSKSNAHGISGLLGLLAFGAAALPCIAIILLTSQLLARPALAPVVLLAWTALALVAARLLFGAAERVFDRRRENLALLM
jgi:hypothetical protein